MIRIVGLGIDCPGCSDEETVADGTWEHICNMAMVSDISNRSQKQEG